MGNRKGFTDTASGLSTERQGGVSSWIQYQLTRAWWIQGRGEMIGIGRSEGLDRGNRQSFLVGLFPSEFSGIRAQVDRERMSLSEKTGYVASLQLNFSIGAHPAHNY